MYNDMILPELYLIGLEFEQGQPEHQPIEQYTPLKDKVEPQGIPLDPSYNAKHLTKYIYK